MQTGLLLIALALGYKIFAEASTNAKKSLKQLGRIIGVYIMAVSFIGTICVLSYAIRYGAWNCSITGKVGKFGLKWCPISGFPSAEQTTATK